MKTILLGKTQAKKESKVYLEGCQIPGYQRIAEEEFREGSPSLFTLVKRTFAQPWNYMVKPQLKRIIKQLYAWKTRFQSPMNPIPYSASSVQQLHLQSGDLVRVRGRDEIEPMLDPFKELKGCAFLEYMWQYCNTTQRVLQPVERFLDERDYKVKKAHGVVLLEGVICHGTPVFGRCDRCCNLFWREEWLEKIVEESA